MRDFRTCLFLVAFPMSVIMDCIVFWSMSFKKRSKNEEPLGSLFLVAFLKGGHFQPHKVCEEELISPLPLTNNIALPLAISPWPLSVPS